MANDAHISLLGTVMTDPTNRQTNTGTTALSLRVAVLTTKRKDNQQFNVTDVYDVSVYGKSAEYLMENVKKTAKVWVTGDFMVGDPWTDRNGEVHTSLKVNANSVKIVVPAKGTSANTPATQPAQSYKSAEDEAPF